HLATKRAQWGTDLDEVFARYEPLIRRAETWERYERVMVAFVSEFHDAHLAWRRTRAASEKKRRIVRLGLSTRFVADALIVDEVWAGAGAERAGLRVGDRIVGIDGETVEQRLGNLTSLRSWSRLEDARYDFAEEWPASRIDADAPVRERRVTRERDDGSYETLRVTPETQPPPGFRKDNLTAERTGQVTVLHVRSLGGSMSALERRIDELLPPLQSEPHGLVVDVRGNAGGYDKGARIVAERLAARPVTGANVRVRLSSRARAERAEWKSLTEDPALPGWSLPQPVSVEGRAPRPYPARLAVLTDAGCRSSCESLVMLLRALGARGFGERTGGSSGAPLTLTLPKSGARVTVPAWAMFDLAGNPIEGRGVAPDEEATATRTDVVTRQDPVLQKALDWVAG